VRDGLFQRVGSKVRGDRIDQPVGPGPLGQVLDPRRCRSRDGEGCGDRTHRRRRTDEARRGLMGVGSWCCSFEALVNGRGDRCLGPAPKAEGQGQRSGTDGQKPTWERCQMKNRTHQKCMRGIRSMKLVSCRWLGALSFDCVQIAHHLVHQVGVPLALMDHLKNIIDRGNHFCVPACFRPQKIILG